MEEGHICKACEEFTALERDCNEATFDSLKGENSKALWRDFQEVAPTPLEGEELERSIEVIRGGGSGTRFSRG